MAKHRRADSKTALGQQRAALRQGGHHKRFVGDDAGEAVARATELARVRRMREEEEQRERVAAAASVVAQGWSGPSGDGAGRREELREHARETSVVELVRELVADGFRLTRTLVAFPFRLAFALRGHLPREA